VTSSPPLLSPKTLPWVAEATQRPPAQSGYLVVSTRPDAVPTTNPSGQNSGETKRCPACELTLPAHDFHKANRQAGGLAGYCKQCSSEKRNLWYRANRDKQAAHSRRGKLKYKYGITEDEYDALLRTQGGGCAICGDMRTDRRLHIDHDHDSGRVRGVLCRACNVSLGQMREKPALLRRAAQYLEDGGYRCSL